MNRGWLLVRDNGWAQRLMQRLSSGQKTRRKQAIVALGRRPLVRCWAMLRDDTDGAWTTELPHPIGHDFKTHVIDGSRSPLCSA